MLGAIIAIAAMAAPTGYLAGSVYLEMNKRNETWLPYACAVFLPLGAMIAAMVITQSETGDEE